MDFSGNEKEIDDLNLRSLFAQGTGVLKGAKELGGVCRERSQADLKGTPLGSIHNLLTAVLKGSNLPPLEKRVNKIPVVSGIKVSVFIIGLEKEGVRLKESEQTNLFSLIGGNVVN